MGSATLRSEFWDSFSLFYGYARVLIRISEREGILTREEAEDLLRELENIYEGFAERLKWIKTDPERSVKILNRFLERALGDRFCKNIIQAFERVLGGKAVYRGLIFSIASYLGEMDPSKIERLSLKDIRLITILAPMHYELYKRGICWMVERNV